MSKTFTSCCQTNILICDFLIKCCEKFKVIYLLIYGKCNNHQIKSTNSTPQYQNQDTKLSNTEDYSWNGERVFSEILIKPYFLKKDILNKIFKFMFLMGSILRGGILSEYP